MEASPNIVSKEGIDKLKRTRGRQPSVDALVKGILEGDTTVLSRAITLVESTQITHLEKAQQIIERCLPYANRSLRIGITGVPGVGKSTFIEVLGKHLTTNRKHVAVLAVDPSSTVTRGSILGDKTRMEALVKDPRAFIRPSPSGSSLGGVARKTRETIVLCEAAGFDIVLIETVGVGQSETTVHGMVDFFLLLKLAGAGDELQGIKRGIIEMADAIVINKADGANLKRARIAQTDFGRALHLYPPKASGWKPEVLLCSALKNVGITEIWDMIDRFLNTVGKTHFLEEHRKQQNKHWLLQTIEERLKADFYENKKIKAALEEQLQKIELRETSPFAAAAYLLSLR